jgi:hypothetical protein
MLVECPNCGMDYPSVQCRWRCPSCGMKDTCCDGEPQVLKSKEGLRKFKDSD